MAAVRGHQVLPDLDLGIRRCACNGQIVCVHYYQANCLDQEAHENYCLGSTGSHLGVFPRHFHRNVGLLPAGALFV